MYIYIYIYIYYIHIWSILTLSNPEALRRAVPALSAADSSTLKQTKMQISLTFTFRWNWMLIRCGLGFTMELCSYGSYGCQKIEGFWLLQLAICGPGLNHPTQNDDETDFKQDRNEQEPGQQVATRRFQPGAGI